MLEVFIPDHDIQEQEVWYKDERLTKQKAIEWFQEQLENYDIKEVPEKYLLRIITYTGSRSNNSVKSIREIVRTI